MLFGDKKIHPLVFDERPYKTYWVRLAPSPKLEYLCFMEDKEDGLLKEKERIYKGCKRELNAKKFNRFHTKKRVNLQIRHNILWYYYCILLPTYYAPINSNITFTLKRQQDITIKWENTGVKHVINNIEYILYKTPYMFSGEMHWVLNI